jgi:hypothetical protein
VSLQHGATVYRLRAREAHGEELARRGEARDPYIE